MAGLDDLFAQIPVQDIAQQLGADSGEVGDTIRTLVPVLLGGLHEHAQEPGQASTIGDAAASLAGGTGDHPEGANLISQIFGGNDVSQVASALSGAGAGNNNLVQRLLPILTPLVLAYIGKQMSQKSAPAEQSASSGGGGLGDVLGSILGGAASGGRSNQSIGSILGNVLGGKTGGAIGDVLGGLLRGGK